MRITELCEMMKSIGRKHNLTEVENTKKKKEKGKPDTIIINPQFNNFTSQPR